MYYEGVAASAALSSVFMFIVVLFGSLISLGATVCRYVGNWFVFKKMGMPGWKSIIPYYNIYQLFDKVWEKKYFWVYLSLLLFNVVAVIMVYIILFAGLILGLVGGSYESLGVSFLFSSAMMLMLMILDIGAAIASTVFAFKLNNRLAHAFGKGAGFAAGLTFLSPIFIMILAFDKSVYLGRRM